VPIAVGRVLHVVAVRDAVEISDDTKSTVRDLRGQTIPRAGSQR
jgi:hypothetical protein